MKRRRNPIEDMHPELRVPRWKLIMLAILLLPLAVDLLTGGQLSMWVAEEISNG